MAKVASLSKYAFNVPAPQRRLKAFTDDRNRDSLGPDPALNTASIAGIQSTGFVNDGRLVVLEWHTDKSLHHARVLVKDIVGDPCAYSLLVFVN